MRIRNVSGDARLGLAKFEFLSGNQSVLGLGRTEAALEESEWAASTASRRAMGWQIPTAFHVLAQARAATGTPGVEEALEQGIEAAASRGHLMTLRRIEADRVDLVAAAR